MMKLLKRNKVAGMNRPVYFVDGLEVIYFIWSRSPLFVFTAPSKKSLDSTLGMLSDCGLSCEWCKVTTCDLIEFIERISE